MKNLNKIFLLLMFVAFSAFTFGQTTITGTITDKSDGSTLPGVMVTVKGTSVGTVSDVSGKYSVNAPAGAKFLIFSYMGMGTLELAISGTEMNVELSSVSEELVEIFVMADRAKDRETPVAFSDITKEEIEQQLGSRDIPLVMNMTPSVYATDNGGGAGDARMNIRGFNQRNVAIMLNGVPINDMENGWVYWSNWDGISDAASSIQIQRGLSAINIATPSIGGTMNIITSPADKKAGGVAKFEYGSGNFMKVSLTGHSGLIKDKFAVSASVIGKQGVGIIDQTWTQAMAYYLGMTYKLNNKHKIELFAMGAPQRHGQNSYKQNIAAYDSVLALDLGADQTTIDMFSESNADESYPGFDGARGGIYYNENWGPVTSTYAGKQYWNGKEHDRYASNFINERENYFHKPLVNLNWYGRWTDKINQYSTVYYSGGTGGGSGTYGSMRWNYHEGIPSPSRFVNYDATIERNVTNGVSSGILRNSVNNQWTVGALSKVKIDITDNLRAQIGIDWRTAKIDHFREVRDLLGGPFFFFDGNEFDTNTDKVLGDKIDYHFTNTVDWIGYFAQVEYSTKQITAYATFGHSFTKYTYENHFVAGTDGNKLNAETDNLPGYQLKGGLSYRPMNGFSVFANYGYISKSPIFDNVIDDNAGTLAPDPKNEIFNAFEIGANYQSPKRDIDIKVNYYYTSWSDRALTRFVQTDENTDALVFLTGVGQLHTGFEFEGFYKPIKYAELGILASIGNWNYTNDVSGTYREYDGANFITADYNYYIADLKVGDAPQTQFGGMLVINPINDLRIQFDARYYTNHYADFSPESRTDETDTDQVWLTPSYFLSDIHISYKLPLKGKFGVEVFGHVFNLLDERYIQDAVDNSAFNANYNGGEFNHDINTAEIYLGLPRRFNAGVKITF